MLQRLEAKGIVKHRKEGKQFVYYPSASNSAVRRKVLADVALEHFGGSLPELLAEARHLVDDASPR
jgi:predicted transcriptional regulator